MDARKLVLFLVGSTFVAVSSGIGVMSSYEQNMPLVTVSLTFFLLGFKISEISISKKFEPRKLVSVKEEINIRRIVLLLLGIMIASFGFSEIGGSISSEETWRSVLGSLYILVGYPMIHYGMEREII